MISLTRAQALGMILLFGFCARAVTYRAPLLDHHAWRQADTAAIARNFATESFNPLRPQVDWRGARAAGEVETGFEAFAVLVAVAAKAGGGFQPEIGRLLAASLFILSGVLFERFSRRRYGDHVAVVTAFVYAFGFPLALYIDRSFMNEPLLICLSIASLVVTDRFLTTGRTTSLLLLAVLTSLIGAIKLPFLIIWAPIAGLFIERDGVRGLRRPALLLVFAVDLAVAAGWYLHAHALAVQSGLTFGMTDKLFDAAIVFSLDFPIQLARHLIKDLFGLTFLFFLLGAGVIWRQRRLCELFAVGGYLAYLLLIARGNYLHDYYQLPIVVIAPVIAALGVMRAGEWLSTRMVRDHTAAVALLLGAIVLSTVVRSVSAHSWYEIDPDVAQACAESRNVLRSGDRLLFLAYSDPKLMFCMDRKGWLLSEEQTGDAQMNDALAAGATVAVVMKVPPTLEGAAWADAHGAAIFDNPSLTMYRLER